MRAFYFDRKVDVSGVSGVGRVADGIQFENGRVAVCWRTPTSSIEIWQNLSDCMQVHSHGGATVPVFIDDEMKQRGTDLDQILEALETQAQPVTAETLKSLHKALSHALPGVYVSFDGDSIGNKVAQAEALDDEPAIQDISSRIRAGGDLFHKWVQRHDGVELEQGGDEGLAKVPEKALEDLETFREDYKRVVSASVTVGVGKKISEATKARMLGKLRGKDRVETFSDSTESSLKAALEARGPQDEAAKMREAGFAKAFREIQDLLKKKSEESDLFEALEVFEKAKPLPVGTIRAWSGKKYQKQSQGWIPVPVQGGKAKNDDSKSPRPAKAKLQIERRQNSRDVDAGGHIKRENSTGTKKPSLESPVQAKTNQHREADRSQGQGKTQVEDSRSTQSILEETLKEMSPEALNFSSGQKALTKDVDYAKIELIPNTATTKFGGTVGTTLNGKGQKVLVKSALATDEAFSTAHKEVAYFNCSRFFGLSNLIPECGGDQQDGTFYSVAEWRHGARPYDSRDREFLQGSVDDGTVHKAAVMNLLLGNVDRHGGNWLVKENRMVLIDNGFSFGFHGGARLPGSTGQIKPRTPRYLQMLLPEGDEVLQEEDFAAALNSVETPDNIKNWVKSLNEERLMQLMEQSHVPSASINQAVRNLQKAKAQVDSDPSFGALIASLLGGISGGSDK